MNGFVNFLFGTPSPTVRAGHAEQDELNLALALSLSEPQNATPEDQKSPLEDGNSVADVASSSETERSNCDDDADAVMADIPVPKRSFDSLPGDLRHSLMMLQKNEGDQKAVANALQHEDVLVSPTNIEVDAHYDEKIEKRVSKFRIPSMKAIFYPSVNRDDSTEDKDSFRESKKRLKSRLESYTLVEYKIAGDGNCQFGSLSDQLYRTPKLAGVLRAMIVKYIRAEAEKYARFVPGDFDEYCDKMEKNGIWGDHLTLQAAADRYGTQINLITSYKDAPFVEIFPQGELKSSRILWLSFFGELHYNSLYTHEDIENRRKMDRPTTSDCVLF